MPSCNNSMHHQLGNAQAYCILVLYHVALIAIHTAHTISPLNYHALWVAHVVEYESRSQSCMHHFAEIILCQRWST